MPALADAKSSTGRRLHCNTVIADSHQTRLCAYLSGILLAGLLLNSVFAWWWADPVAAIGIGILAINEGRDAWQGDTCCD
jgi:divalent metal cation (Fe/Co/Zn/Cd) transporter